MTGRLPVPRPRRASMRFLTVVTSVDVVHIAILRREHAAPTTNYLAKLQS